MRDGNQVTLEEGLRLLNFGKKGGSKYKAKRCEVDGIKFQSEKEAAYYVALKQRKVAGELSGFVVKPSFPLDVKGLHICDYVADFAEYYPDSSRKIVDVKGWKNPKCLAYRLFKFKSRLMKAIYNIDVVEV